MGVFILMYIALALVGIATSMRSNTIQSRKTQTVLCFLFVWLIQALRLPSCGGDVTGWGWGIGYLGVFHNVADTGWLDLLYASKDSFAGFEKGFVLFNKLISAVFGPNDQVYLAVVSFFYIVPIAYIFYKRSHNIPLSFALFTSFGPYVFSFSGLRQAVAISIIFVAFDILLNEKKTKWFFGLVLLASFFHTSAIICLLAYPVLRWFLITKEKKVVSYVVIAISIPVLMFLLNFVTSYVITDRYQELADESASAAYGLFVFYMLIFPFTFIIENESMQKLRTLFFIAIIFQSAGLFSVGSTTRMTFYFAIFLTLIVPELLKSRKSFSSLYPAVYILSFAYLYKLIGGGYLNIVPYYFYWEGIY